jgi:hypothetical protein
MRLRHYSTACKILENVACQIYSDGETCCLAIELAERISLVTTARPPNVGCGMQPARPTRVTAQYRARLLLLFCRTANGVTTAEEYICKPIEVKAAAAAGMRVAACIKLKINIHWVRNNKERLVSLSPSPI